jgi:hypothetical protein
MTSCAEQTLSTFLSQLACVHTAQLTEPLTASTSSLELCLTSFSMKDCRIPSLSLLDLLTPEGTAFEVSSEAASKRLSTPLNLKATKLTAVPVILLHNICASFQWLLERRMKKALEVLKQQCCNKEWALEICNYLESDQCPLALSAASTCFHALPHLCSSNGKTWTTPFLYETVFQVSLLNQRQFRVVITAPGRVTGTYETDYNSFTDLHLCIETDVLYLDMKKKCTEVILEAILHVRLELTNRTTYRIGESNEQSCHRDNDYIENKKRIMYSPKDISKMKRSRSSTPLTGISGLLAAAVSIN